MHGKGMLSLLKKTIIFIVSGLLLLQGSIPTLAHENPVEREIVKAGFFACDGYHVQDEDGKCSGYGYDFLKMAESYQNWTFEFVGYSRNWTSMMQMLDHGEIDLVTFAQKTEEREEKYDFSDKPIGTGSIILTVRDDDTRYVAGGTESYNGMRIGVEVGTTHDEHLRKLAEERQFKYSAIYYSSTGALQDAFYKGDVDGMVTTSVRTIRNEVILEEMNPTDFYVMVKKGNTELLEKINDAIGQMDACTPGWRATLKDKYFSGQGGEVIVLNQEEREYLEQLQQQHTVLQVVTHPDLAPYSSYDKSGKPVGIAPEIFEEIADRVGLAYEYVSFETYEEYNSFIRNGGADIDLTCFSDYGLAAVHGISLTNPYMSTSLAMLTKEVSDGRFTSVGLLRAAENNTIYGDKLLEGVHVVNYDTHAECIEAVASGQVDATYLYTYTAQKAVEEDVRNRLLYSIMPEYNIDIAFGINENLDYRLLKILNKGISCLEGNSIQQIIQNRLADIEEKESFLSMIYDYPFIALGILVLILLVLFVVLILVIRISNEQRMRAQAAEISRFMGYVCEANASVMEVNMDTRQCTRHNMVDGELTSEIIPYEFEHFQNENEQMYQEDFEKIASSVVAEAFHKLLSGEREQIYFEARMLDEAGAYRWYSYTIRHIPKSEAHPHNFVLFKKDIDEATRKSAEQRKALEDALQAANSASQAKGQFLSKMSHEIRTPLNAVIGYMQIAKDAGDNLTKMQHCIENGEMAARHLLNIINDVLDISSIESGKMQIAREPFDLKNQIMTLSNIFYHQTRQKKVHFEVIVKDITEEHIVGDSLRLNQILMNLLSNAVKFTPEGGTVSLTVEQTRQDEQNVYLRFCVKDTGIGMSEEYQKKMFLPFVQESATTAQKYGGTGLGLSIAQNLVHMMGGSIEADSHQGEGTTFYVSLGFGRIPEQTSVKQTYPNKRILVVDADVNSGNTAREQFKYNKIKCDIVTDLDSAGRQLRRRQNTEYGYEVCIIDWNIMEQAGMEAVASLVQEYGSGMKFAGTSYDITECEEALKSIGIDYMLTKPVFDSNMQELFQSLYGTALQQSVQEKHLENLEGLRILLAEDNEMNLEIALDILGKAGLDVEAVPDGKQAFDRFISHPAHTYDAILMDVQMPVMDGYQATGAIRKSGHEEAESIPIIAMTANAFVEDVNNALTSGMNDHIAKPVDYDKLYKVLSKYCKR